MKEKQGLRHGPITKRIILQQRNKIYQRNSPRNPCSGILRLQTKEACCESYLVKHTTILRCWKFTLYNSLAKGKTKLFFCQEKNKSSRKTKNKTFIEDVNY